MLPTSKYNNECMNLYGYFRNFEEFFFRYSFG